MPDYDLAIVSFDNRTYAATSNINVTVLDTIISSSGLTPRVVPPSDILEQRKNELMTVLPGFEAAESSGLFAENFFLDTPMSIWQEEAQSVFSDAGQIGAVGPVRALNQLRGSFDVEGELQNLRIFFTLTPEKSPQIQQLRITSISADN